jgi:hypothetical protein
VRPGPIPARRKTKLVHPPERLLGSDEMIPEVSDRSIALGEQMFRLDDLGLASLGRLLGLDALSFCSQQGEPVGQGLLPTLVLDELIIEAAHRGLIDLVLDEQRVPLGCQSSNIRIVARHGRLGAL